MSYAPYTFIYKPETVGLIQLKKISENVTILKIYIQDLVIVNEPEEDEEIFYEDSTEVMLSNFSVEYKSLDELHNKTIHIEKGFNSEMLLAMLSVFDGEEINNINITFKKIEEGCFEIFWTGYYGEGEQDYDDIEIKTIVYQTNNDIITPICLYDSELVEFYSK